MIYYEIDIYKTNIKASISLTPKLNEISLCKILIRNFTKIPLTYLMYMIMVNVWEHEIKTLH